MNKGSIEVMDRKQVLLSSELIHLMQNKLYYDDVKKILKNEFHELSNSFGSKRQDLMKNIEDIFDIYGLGKLEINDIDEKKQSASLNVYNSSIAHAHLLKNQNSSEPICHLTKGMLAGIFSFIFNCDVECDEIKCYAKGDEYCEFRIKRGE